jgi:hypothetical protein
MTRFFTVFTLFLFAALGIAHNVKHGEAVCVDEVTVKAILELHYRDAIIELTDGRKHTVNQATLKPGDKFCLKYGYPERKE